MSIFAFLSGIFKPAADLVDELHFSGEEAGRIKTKLAEIEAQVATRLMDLQSQAIDSNAKIAQAEQEHGNSLSKAWRPIVSLIMALLLVLSGLDIITYRPLLVQIAGGFLGIYGIGRSVEKSKKN